ncbi:MAG: sugar transferase [Clostridia bacterium]|nr:sugar transferase [Clostridia bacterium]
MDKLLKNNTRQSKVYHFIKRGTDIILSAALIVFLSPLMAIIASVVALTSEGGAFFKQKRLGREERIFVCLKFRTMYTDAPHDVPTTEFVGMEKHITHVGKILRRTSLDELPQLFNVLLGDMSMVGPRPLILNEGEITRMRREAGVYSVRPGITGFAQINGRDNVTDREKTELDKLYIEEMSFFTDLTILIMTPIRALRGKDIKSKKQ